MITFNPVAGNLNTYSLYQNFSETVLVESDLGTITSIIVTPSEEDDGVIISTDNETFFTISGMYTTVLGGFNFRYVLNGFSDKNSTPVVETDPEAIPLNADIYTYNPALTQQDTIFYSAFVEVDGVEDDTQQFDIIVVNNWDVGRDILLDLLAERA